MPGDYLVLAPIYNQIGMGDFAREQTPSLIEFAQQNDWLGRHILDLGCGTGESLIWLARRGYRVTAFDNAEAMLDEAKAGLATQGLDTRIQDIDIREFTSEQVGTVDLVLALDVINEMTSIREIETVLSNIHGVLQSGKWLILDLHTLQGLSRQGRDADAVIFDDPEQLTVVQSNHYDYEHHAYTSEYLIFRRDGVHWRRHLARRVLRTLPIQAMLTLLQRTGFTVEFTLDTRLQRFDPASIRTDRVILIVSKV